MSLPFRISETHAGFGRCEGVVHLEAGKLIFEFQSKVAGILKSDIKMVEVPVDELATVTYKGGLFANKGTIQFKSLRHTQAFPKADGNEVTLEVKRRDRDAAQEFVKEVRMDLLSHSLDDMLEMTDKALG